MAFIATLALLLIPGMASAAAYGTAGCGLGSMAFGDDPGMMQVLAATTNGLSGNQTFGITSGTSNCAADSGTASIDQQAFIKVNYASLVRDAAEGKGEYLSAFATLLGCNTTAHETFFTMTQTKHDMLFKAETAPLDTLTTIKGAMAQDTLLAAQCNRI